MIRRDKEYKAQDKVTQKMGRDGLIEQNKATGEVNRISGRAQDVSFNHITDPEAPTGRLNVTAEGSRLQQQPVSSLSAPAPMRGTDDQPVNTSTKNSSFVPKWDEAAIQGSAPAGSAGVSPVQHCTENSPIVPPSASFSRLHFTPEGGRIPAARSRQHSARMQQILSPAPSFPSSTTVSPPLDTGQPVSASGGNAESTNASVTAPITEQKRKRTLHFSNGVFRRNKPFRLEFTPEEQQKEASRTNDATQDQPKPQESDAPASPLHDAESPLHAEPPSPEQLKADKKATRAENKVRKTGQKMERAQENLPKRTRLKFEKQFDPETGKTKRLHFEQEILPRGYKGPVKKAVYGAGYAVLNKAHQKISEVEHENVGVEAAHKGERIAEKGIRFVSRRISDAPYRKVTKLQRKAAKAKVNSIYRAALRDDPKLRAAMKNRNVVSKLLQRRKLKKQYAKAVRKVNQDAVAAAKTAGSTLLAAGKSIGRFLIRHKGILVPLLMAGLMMLMFAACMSACSALLGGGTAAAVGYKAEDVEIHDADLHWTENEQSMVEDIRTVESSRPDYDEYRYWLDGRRSSAAAMVDTLTHDPFKLIAYVSALYEDFTFEDIQAVLDSLFDELYQLDYDEESETRTYTDDDGNEVEYEYTILNVRLTTKDFEETINEYLQEVGQDQQDIYDVYMETMGAHQQFGNPLEFNWQNSVTSLYGARENPTGPGSEIHRGLDVAAPHGSPLHSAIDGEVIVAGWQNNGFGNTVIVKDKDGVQIRYAHCSAILTSVGQKVKKGDVIAKVGSTGNSTGNHVHIEVKDNGQYLNPIFLFDYLFDE